VASPLPRECSTTELKGHCCPMPNLRTSNETGAGEGNRTLVISLEGFSSTIELHPQGRPLRHQLTALTCTATAPALPIYNRLKTNRRCTPQTFRTPCRPFVTGRPLVDCLAYRLLIDRLLTACSLRPLLGGGGWIRTSVLVRGQIYSLLPLTTRPPLRREPQTIGEAMIIVKRKVSLWRA
jgi:hypothetical protein